LIFLLQSIASESKVAMSKNSLVGVTAGISGSPKKSVFPINEPKGAPFVVKTYQLVSEPSNSPYVSWSDTKDSFIVWNPVDFAADILPHYFKHNNFCSFIRQLNTYGFRKAESKQWEFKHDLFLEKHPEMLKDISRRKSKKREATSDPSPNDFSESDISPPLAYTPPSPFKEARSEPSVTKCDEKEDIDQLRNMNSILMKEVIRLQHQQESTQDTIKQILGELIQSRKQQEDLLNKVGNMTQDINKQTLENVPLLMIAPNTKPEFYTSSPVDTQIKLQPNITNIDSLESFLSADNFFSLDELPQFDLTSGLGGISPSDLNGTSQYSGEQFFIDQ